MQTPTTSTQPATNPADSLDQRARDLQQQALLGIEGLLDGGRRQAAAAALGSLLRRSSPALAAEILERAAVAELARDMAWVPPQQADVRYVPGSRVTRRRGERRAPTAADLADSAGAAAAAAYLAEQPPAAVDPATGWDEPVWGTLDYDLAALTPLRGAACLGCRCERTRADLGNRDGLCVDCREAGLTRTAIIERCCAAVAEHNTPARAAELLRRAWRRAGRAEDKAVVAAWVAAHSDVLPPADAR